MRFIGDRSKLDAKLRKLMDGIEERTAQNSRINFTVAINYGGRDEITRAAKALALKVAAGGRLPPRRLMPRRLRRIWIPRACPIPIW